MHIVAPLLFVLGPTGVEMRVDNVERLTSECIRMSVLTTSGNHGWGPRPGSLLVLIRRALSDGFSSVVGVHLPSAKGGVQSLLRTIGRLQARMFESDSIECLGVVILAVVMISLER